MKVKKEEPARGGRRTPPAKRMIAGSDFYVAPQPATSYQPLVRSLAQTLGMALLLAVATVAATPPTQTELLTPPPSDGPFVVQTGFQLLDITMIDDQSETFEFTGILSVQWKDTRQAFDPATEGVSEKFYQGNFQFNEISTSWYPEISLLNTAGTFEKGEPLLRIQPDGTSILVTPVSATAKSELQLRHYPFDRQSLQVIFAMPGYTDSEVVLQPLPLPALAASDIRVPQWELSQTRDLTETVLPTTPGQEGRTSVYIFEMDVKRQGAFVMRLVIGPLFLVVILSWSVFWMDRASVGDRMSVSFVGLLTAVAYQIVLGDILPHIAYLTPVNVFVNISFITMCASIAVNLFVGELNCEGRAAQADALDNRCKIIFPVVYFSLLALTILIFAIVF
jgi:hypothetical protein